MVKLASIGLPHADKYTETARECQYYYETVNKFIERNKNCGNLDKATHAAQDLATPGHAGQPWTGFGWNWVTVKHILGDLFPSYGTFRQAYQNTLGVFQ